LHHGSSAHAIDLEEVDYNGRAMLPVRRSKPFVIANLCTTAR
jgi:hypothetical protein